MRNASKLKFQAVIFDMDGVIADTMHYHYLANKAIANELGLSFEIEDNEKFKGISRRDIIESLVAEAKLTLPASELEAMSEKKNAIYKKHLASMNESDVLEGILPFLKELKSAGKKMAVASSSANAVTVLEKLNVLDYFDYVVDSTKIVNGKPNPEILLNAPSYLGIPPENCVAIEDGEAGLSAILQTGMFSVSIGDSLFLQNADYCISTAVELSLEEIEKRFLVKKRYVIGLDGGGTYTRAVLGNLSGEKLAVIKRNGGAHPGKNRVAKENVQQTIKAVIEEAGIHLSDVAVVACGIAGLNHQDDLAWATEFTAIPGLESRNIYVNDAIIAHRGAFKTSNGIIAIAGTGSIVVGVAPDGNVVRNYDFNHLANAGARYLTITALNCILSGMDNETDQLLINELLRAFGVETVKALSEFYRLNCGEDGFQEVCGNLAPIITYEARAGSSIAQSACLTAMKNLSLGVKLVSSAYEEETIAVVPVGGVLEDPYMLELFKECLTEGRKKFTVEILKGSSVDGALKLALDSIRFP